MRPTRALVAGAAALASCATLAAAGPATAAPRAAQPPTAEIQTAYGRAEIAAGFRYDPYGLDPVVIRLWDRLADGYSVSVQLVTMSPTDGTITWKARVLNSGNGTEGGWLTYARPGGQVTGFAARICRVKTSTGLSDKCLVSRAVWDTAG
ncbi:hypothetical protein ACIO3O_23730 [Streptomyces sp. NPDC087440]|uniref:hypothetical protein n=1 Tax=Streptomyces sp. NPDC087440 TaxID=3365790 RepID=UPI003829A154